MPLLDTLSDSHGVGPVCHELNIAPSTYYRHRESRQHPEKRSLRDRRDDQLKPEQREGRAAKAERLGATYSSNSARHNPKGGYGKTAEKSTS